MNRCRSTPCAGRRTTRMPCTSSSRRPNTPGGPNHWSFGNGMLWLTGHWEWHCVACYVVVPLEGEPTLVYSMGGTHIEAVRRETSAALTDVRQSRGGRFAEVMADRITALRLERGRSGLLEVHPRFGDYLPV